MNKIYTTTVVGSPADAGEFNGSINQFLQDPNNAGFALVDIKVTLDGDNLVAVIIYKK